jgi:hypothetical protein
LEVSQTIQRKFKKPYEDFDDEVEYAWSGFFGVINDGLPLTEITD